MAKHYLQFSTFVLLIISANFIQISSQRFSSTLSMEDLGLKRRRQVTHLHFYFHDIASGRKPTAVQVAQAPITNSSATGFGSIVMIDDPLTLRPEFGSKIVGRAQGIYGSADLKEMGLLMVLNFVFTEGKFNGSTLSLHGRNSVLSTVREMPIVGGSGVFRFANGYAEARSHRFNYRTGDAVVEYNVYVFHY